MRTADDPEIGSLWRRKKTGFKYIVRGFCLIQWTDEIGVLYRSAAIIGEGWNLGAGITSCRSLEGFMERFEPIAAAGQSVPQDNPRSTRP